MSCILMAANFARPSLLGIFGNIANILLKQVNIR